MVTLHTFKLVYLRRKNFFRALICAFISGTAPDFVPFLFEYAKYETITEFYSFTHFCADAQIEMQARGKSGFFRISIPKNPKNLENSQKIPKKFQKFQRIPKNPKKSRKIPNIPKNPKIRFFPLGDTTKLSRVL